MHSISWPTLLASAVVAAVTTLLVEYLAKPWLEARKDRIIEYNREQRAALKDVRRAAYLAMWLCNHYEGSKGNTTVTEVGRHINEEAFEMAQEIGELIANARGVVDVPTWMNEEWAESTERILAFTVALRLAPAPQELTCGVSQEMTCDVCFGLLPFGYVTLSFGKECRIGILGASADL